MTDLRDIERMTGALAEKGDELAKAVARLERDLKALRARHLPRIMELAEAYGTDKQQLSRVIGDNPGLFRKPKTHVFHGIRVGLAKAKGALTFEDEAKVLERIKAVLPDQAASLINTTEKPAKTALEKLSAKLLKRLGITVTDASDKPVIKTQIAEVESMVKKLVERAEGSGGA